MAASTKTESRTERDDRIRGAMVAGTPRDEIATNEGVSRATVDRVLRTTTDSAVKTATKAGDKKRAAAAAAKKAERAEAKRTARETAKEQPEREQADPSVAEDAPTRAPSQRIATTRKDALAFNDKWTDADRELLAKQLDRVEAKSFQRPGSGSYIRVEARDGSIVAAIEKGRIRFPKGSAPKGATKLDEKWSALDLSTRRGA